jgi:hypothetical protein
MNRFGIVALALFVLSGMTACSLGKQASAPPTNAQAPKAEATPQAQQPANTGSLQPGQAVGTCTAKGETIQLKYAYAGKGVRFGNDSIIILVTDNPIPPEAVAEEIKSQTLFNAEKIRGLEYVFDKDGHWVRFHPSQYQESSSTPLKEYTIDSGIVRGFDDGESDLSGGKYARSVRFAAAFIKE